ncbi:hypothetical protein ABN09_01450, partial [Morganella morganii]
MSSESKTQTGICANYLRYHRKTSEKKKPPRVSLPAVMHIAYFSDYLPALFAVRIRHLCLLIILQTHTGDKIQLG